MKYFGKLTAIVIVAATTMSFFAVVNVYVPENRTTQEFDGTYEKTQEVAFIDNAKEIRLVAYTEQLSLERKAEDEKLEAERLERERLEAERLEAERLEAERLEAERLERERLETERLEAERLEAEKLAAEALGDEGQGTEPTVAETNEELSPPSIVLSFEQAGRVSVNGICNGFFISPSQVVTSSHCVSSDATVNLQATGEEFSATVSSSIPGKSFAILTINGSNSQARTLAQRKAVLGETVTVYSRHSGTYQTTITQQIPGTVKSLGNGKMQLMYQDTSLGSTLNFFDVASAKGDSGSIIIGQDGAFLGVLAGGDGATFTVFVS